MNGVLAPRNHTPKYFRLRFVSLKLWRKEKELGPQELLCTGETLPHIGGIWNQDEEEVRQSESSICSWCVSVTLTHLSPDQCLSIHLCLPPHLFQASCGCLMGCLLLLLLLCFPLRWRITVLLTLILHMILRSSPVPAQTADVSWSFIMRQKKKKHKLRKSR